jgi:hypothetical protein
MASHTTYRGLTIDMDSMRRENEKTPAVGNHRVNAKGDQLTRGGVITKTINQVVTEHNSTVKSDVVATGLKGPIPDVVETVKPTVVKKVKEKELPNGDIVV